MIRRLLPLAIFLGLCVLLLAGVLLSRDPQRDVIPSPLIGRPAPEFDLPDLHDPERRIRSSDLRGTPYVVNVWGSWCPECRIEHPAIARLAETGRIRVVGYNYKDERADALRWLQQFGDPYALVPADEEGRAALDWGIYGAPETFFIDAEGIVRWKHVGALTDEIVEREILARVDAAGTGSGE
ncbi:DsbE family thiol:disulfide interchange protein [Coralloluteibacterium thermophilus]|uniref:DsbE family thiol:disulfide interchange protein n=1 Tax=Coralloluteibacterium thermophilum TaxID=2707049 RepID=A0ABV9NS25_9GAMM